ncbi:MAG: phasin family protein [Burkholderiaceae bacterium]
MTTPTSPISTEQFTAAYQANLETMFALSQTAFSGVEKIVALNLNVARANLQESADKARAVLSVKDPQELMAWNAQQLQPAAEKAVAYSRLMYDIATSTQADLTKVAEAQLSDANAKFVAMIDTAAKSAPAGSETAVAMMKSAVAAASSAYESLSKAAQQAVEMTEANVTAATDAAVKNTTRAKK